MLTKDILFGMNILTLVGFVVMGITLTLKQRCDRGFNTHGSEAG